MSQSEINDAEWNNPENWSGIGPFKVYFSKRDSRVWVPLWWNGTSSPHTFNFGNRWGFPCAVLLQFFVFAVWVSIIIMMKRQP